MKNERFLCGLLCAVAGGYVMGCSDGADVVARGPDGGVTAKTEAVRTACGSVVISGDFGATPPDACKECMEDSCCAEAEACAGNAECMAFRDCWGRCSTTEECNACDAMPATAENSAFMRCRASCTACMDLQSCVASPTVLPPEPRYPITLTLSSYTGGGIVFPGITVMVCNATDDECKAPLSRGVTAEDGTTDVELPGDLSSTYLEMTGPNLVPTRSYLQFALAKGVLEGHSMRLGLLDNATADALRGVLGTTQDQAEVGLVTVFARSCGDRNLARATVESSAADAQTIRQYQDGAAPSAAASTTDASGVAVFGDHPVGPTTITVRSSTGATIGTRTILVRAGYLNSAMAIPSQ